MTVETPADQPADLADPGAAAPVPPPTLQAPAGGVPPVVDTAAALDEVCRGFAAAAGPVALDAERASGHRYGQRAFLVQAKRAGAGIALLDPEALPDLTGFAAAIGDAEWILHSATQDLPCLADLGLQPARLFDTELAARLLGLERVGLAALVERYLGWHLSKGHSAADWSVRPLPESYLRYAALDVELLIELRDRLAADLQEAGKLAWAQQEFDALTRWRPVPRADPWRRTSGLHQLRTSLALAVARSLWTAREQVAQEVDRAPGRVLPDAAIVSAAAALPRSRAALAGVPGFTRSRRIGTWWAAVESALGLPPEGLPPMAMPFDGPPPPKLWARRDPAAAARFTAARRVVTGVAQTHGLPPEVLIGPDLVRRLCWEPPAPADAGQVAAFLAGRGARAWQADLLAAPLAGALGAVTTRE
jgi:ribonuclease D